MALARVVLLLNDVAALKEETSDTIGDMLVMLQIQGKNRDLGVFKN